MRTLTAIALILTATASTAQARTVTLPGPSYEVLHSAPATGARPTRADTVAIRYVGRLPDGTIFSTSADEGRGVTTFPVRGVVPGFMALVRLMRPGDRWRFHLPAYLAYGAEGRHPMPDERTLKHDVPAGTPLTFDVELVEIVAPD